MSETLRHRPAAVTTPLEQWPGLVVCGVDGTRQGRDACRQAAMLAAPHGRLVLHAVEHGDGAAARWSAALQNAAQLVDPMHVPVETCVASAATVAAGLIRAADGADVLVVGCDAFGPTPKAVLRHAPCSVLLARRPLDLPVFDLIMVGENGPPHVHSLVAHLASEHGSEWRAVETAKLPLAAAAMGCGLVVTGDGPHARALAQVAPCSVLVIREP